MTQYKQIYKVTTTFLVALITLGASLSAQAIQFELGASLSTVITRVSDTSSNKSTTDTVAVIATKAAFVPFFSLVGEENYFGDETYFGWTYQIWGSTFSVDQQEIDGDFKDDFNTKIDGGYFYILPQVYYRFGDRFVSKPVDKWRVTVGMGYGLSYVDIEGDVRLSKKSADTEAKTVKVSASDTYYSFGLFVKASYDKVFFSITNNLPQLRDNDNDLLFRINNISYTIGYDFTFDFDFFGLL